jgi:TonB family protein
MAANAEIFFEHDRWAPALGWSLGLHVGITAALLILSAVLSAPTRDRLGRRRWWRSHRRYLGEQHSSYRSPIRRQPECSGQRIEGVDEIAAQAEEVKEPDAIPDSGQEFEDQAEKTPNCRVKKNRRPAPEEETNQVAFGEGGPVSGPYGAFSAAGAKGGFGFTGGGGDFGTLYAWYVQTVQQKVSENWLKYEVDPGITTAQRVYITFDVARDGHPFNVQVEQSSGVPSLDISAVRAIQRIDTFGPLPPDYSGSKVSVEFWFDYKR